MNNRIDPIRERRGELDLAFDAIERDVFSI